MRIWSSPSISTRSSALSPPATEVAVVSGADPLAERLELLPFGRVGKALDHEARRLVVRSLHAMAADVPQVPPLDHQSRSELAVRTLPGDHDQIGQGHERRHTFAPRAP